MKKLIMKINGYEIEYYESGKNTDTTLVFAHGLGGNADQWIDQLEYFVKDYRVIAFSLQGHGGSSKPAEDFNYSISQYAKTATGLLNKLKIKKCIWIGNSMGGVIGYEVIKTDSSLIKMLITNGTTPELIFSSLGIKLVETLDKVLIKLLKLDGYIKFMVKHTSKNNIAQEKLYQIMKQVAPQAVIASRRALGNYSYINIIKKTNIPIIIIKAPLDKDINKSIQKLTAKLNSCENVKFVELNNAGHVANLDQTQKYNELIDKILQDIFTK